MAQPSRKSTVFNPMRVAPPPIPPADTTFFDPKEFVSMVAEDGYVFLVHKERLRMSKLLRKYLDGMGTSVREVEFDARSPDRLHLRFPFTSSPVLEKVIQYLYYKYQYEKGVDSRPEFHIPPQISIELMKLATVLQC